MYIYIYNTYVHAFTLYTPLPLWVAAVVLCRRLIDLTRVYYSFVTANRSITAHITQQTKINGLKQH